MTIKPHSVFHSLFTDKQLVADFSSYYDLVFYLNSMQPAFMNYLRRQQENGIQESYVFLDKNLRQIQLDELQIRRAKDGDIIHIVPAIVGGGGKRGLFAILALAAFAFAVVATGGAAAVAAGATGGGGGLGAVAGASAGGAAIGGGVTLSSMLTNVAANIGLALVSMLFAPKPQAAESTRENDAFGSLVNSTNSGTPVGLHYGLVRVAGQLISGYISTVNHAKNEEIDVYGDVSGETVTTTSTGEVVVTERIPRERPD